MSLIGNDETTIHILSFLTAEELLAAGTVNYDWFLLSSQDYLWNILLIDAPFDISKLANKALCKKNSYIISDNDSRRLFLTRDELCSKWDFRFKEDAGEAWMDICPWYT
jgi:hypothetical protein